MNLQMLFEKNNNASQLFGKWVVIADGFYGDNGKGKISNFICYYLNEMGLDISWCMRPNGGANAGHEVFAPWGPFGLQESYKGHIVPMGILQGIPSLIGPGTVLDPTLLFEHELKKLDEQGIDIEKVFVSPRAHLILPIYKLLEQAQEKLKGKDAVGTTGKGIGQAYEFRANRYGIQVKDLYGNYVELEKKIKLIYELINPILQKVNSNNIELGQHSDPDESLDVLLQYAYRLSKMTIDEQKIYKEIRENGSIGVMEMGQGTGLDNIHGSYPFVTSSLTTIPAGLAQAGLSHKDLGYGILVVKGPYLTRVGAGEFPTEMDRDTADKFRRLGKEFGTTTGRARRCGYTDLLFLRHAINLNGPDCICLTKMDITGDEPLIKVRLTNGKYVEVDGWNGADILKARKVSQMPYEAQSFINLVNNLMDPTKKLATLISTGPSLEDIVMLPGFLE